MRFDAALTALRQLRPCTLVSLGAGAVAGLVVSSVSQAHPNAPFGEVVAAGAISTIPVIAAAILHFVVAGRQPFHSPLIYASGNAVTVGAVTGVLAYVLPGHFLHAMSGAASGLLGAALTRAAGCATPPSRADATR